MTFVIPSAVDLMTDSVNNHPNNRGGFAGGTIAAPEDSTSQKSLTKNGGNLPLVDQATGNVIAATNLTSSIDGTLAGFNFGFPTALDVSTDALSKVIVWTYQFNAPNRVQTDTAANRGVVFRLSSGSGSPPTKNRSWYIAGNDKVGASARENPKMIVVDPNDTTFDASVGVFSNTDIQTFGLGVNNLSITGTGSSNFFPQRIFVFDTIKNATNIPRFTGTSSWDDMITAMGNTYETKITDDWIRREGGVFSYAAPFEIGDGTTTTNFDDGGVSVFWPNATQLSDPDPRVRVTNKAFRAYMNLRDDFNDSATFSGFYNCGSSNPDWDFNISNQSFISFNNATFLNTGTFTVGSSVSGNATFDGCGIVRNNGADLFGSTLKNPNSTHLMRLTP